MVKGELGNTLTLKFKCRALIETAEGEEYVSVTPDTVAAYMADSALNRLYSLSLEQIDDGDYYVFVFLDPSVLQVGKTYYAEFEWTREGITKLEREAISVVADIPQL